MNATQKTNSSFEINLKVRNDNSFYSDTVLIILIDEFHLLFKNASFMQTNGNKHINHVIS